MEINGITVEIIKEEVSRKAYAASEKFFNTYLGGVDSGCCGFAWCTVTPKNKGNTRAGKEERKILEALGFKQSYDRSYSLWNPSKFPAQNVDTLYEGAKEAASVLQNYGISAHARERLD